MTRSKRIKPVQQLTQSRERKAMQELGQSQQHLQAQQAKLEELRGYRDQYARDFEATGGAGLDAARLRDFRLFLNRLGEAIKQQEALIAQCLHRHEQTRRHWLASRNQSQAVDKLVDRYRRQEDRQQARSEQKEQDDRAQRSSTGSAHK